MNASLATPRNRLRHRRMNTITGTRVHCYIGWRFARVVKTAY
jgi:hypothetical protein